MRLQSEIRTRPQSVDAHRTFSNPFFITAYRQVLIVVMCYGEVVLLGFLLLLQIKVKELKSIKTGVIVLSIIFLLSRIQFHC